MNSYGSICSRPVQQLTVPREFTAILNEIIFIVFQHLQIAEVRVDSSSQKTCSPKGRTRSKSCVFLEIAPALLRDNVELAKTSLPDDGYLDLRKPRSAYIAFFVKVIPELERMGRTPRFVLLSTCQALSQAVIFRPRILRALSVSATRWTAIIAPRHSLKRGASLAAVFCAIHNQGEAVRRRSRIAIPSRHTMDGY